MRKDSPVCEFSLKKHSRNTYYVDIVKMIDEKKLPPVIRNGLGIGEYVIDRFEPVYRRGLSNRVIVGAEPIGDSLENMITYTSGLSLIDDLWIKEKNNETKNWSRLNLFENEINEEVATIAFTRDGEYKTKSFISSPEFTTDGMMSKAWRRIKGDLYLYKSGPSRWRRSSSGSTQFSEFYASQIAQRLELNYVNYDIDTWMGKLCSVCGLFTSQRYSYIAAQNYFVSDDIFSYIQRFPKDSRMYQSFADTILFDAITGNRRHQGNIGLIEDNEICEIVSLAPIFDNGSSLFNDLPDDLLIVPHYTSQFTKVSARWWGDEASVNDIKNLLTERQFKLAKNMEGFVFRRHKDHNLSESRLKVLERILQKRTQALL